MALEHRVAALWDEQDPRQLAVEEGHSKGELVLEIDQWLNKDAFAHPTSLFTLTSTLACELIDREHHAKICRF